jgi:hypothetical protein
MDTDTLALLRAGKLVGIRRLDLSCGLTEFPPEIFSLADSLEILNLSGNRLTSLPADLNRLRRLQAIFCSDNEFTELPLPLGQCDQLDMVGFKANRIEKVDGQALPARLRWLILTDNRIAELPAALGQRPRLQKLMLAGNRLQGLPDSIAHCKQLELLRISANKFETLPEWLTALPRLAWLAFAGNPVSKFADVSASTSPIPAIDWHDLEIGALLGEGASGVIHQAIDSSQETPRPVAVKIFKGAITSDGAPANEMAACVKAGMHTALIGAVGRLSHHPTGADGLVMPLVDPAFRVLAGPPSLESCTRDVYPIGTGLMEQQTISVAQTIASAIAHLHAQGILHGDLYGHNILHDGNGEALLGDFGAATLTGPAADHLCRLESRAFGCLLEELIDHSAWSAPLMTHRRRLERMRDECLSADVGSRPLFRAMEAELTSMALEARTAMPTN